jgi:carotenoid 1,2-hydratase
LTVIAFLGSVFSPYYRRARERGCPDPEQHVAINVALYGPGVGRWTMTERGAAALVRGARELAIGPSALRWSGERLELAIDEWAVPLPRRVRGRIQVWPQGLSRYVAPLDTAGLHRWGPIAPAARVEVEFDMPALRWSGQGYLDCNEGDEPIERPFRSWDWSRAQLAGGDTAVLYDVRERSGAERLLALRFARDGRVSEFDAPQRRPLPGTLWRVPRQMRAEAAPVLVRTLEDTPFYVRSELRTRLLGEDVNAMHETLEVPRLDSAVVQWMLPWRMPRRA